MLSFFPFFKNFLQNKRKKSAPHHVLLPQLKLPQNAQNHPEVFYLIQFGFVNPISQANQSVRKDGDMIFLLTVHFVQCNATKKVFLVGTSVHGRMCMCKSFLVSVIKKNKQTNVCKNNQIRKQIVLVKTSSLPKVLPCTHTTYSTLRQIHD